MVIATSGSYISQYKLRLSQWKYLKNSSFDFVEKKVVIFASIVHIPLGCPINNVCFN